MGALPRPSDQAPRLQGEGELSELVGEPDRARPCQARARQCLIVPGTWQIGISQYGSPSGSSRDRHTTS